MNDNFKFFVPLDFEKSKDPADKGKMIVTGVASTRDLDSDKEVLEPEGFDLSRFLKSGYINPSGLSNIPAYLRLNICVGRVLFALSYSLLLKIIPAKILHQNP